jgi:hypothetical protein
MFWLRYQVRDGGGNLVTVETPLDPAPTDVEYPETRHIKQATTQDGATIVQRPLRDPRVRKWRWTGHQTETEPYATQWALLASLETRARVLAGLPATVEIWEDVSGIGGFDRMDGANRQYTTVRFLQVDRAPRKGGGPVVYESVVEFIIADPTYSTF